jgi:hypothetical protein
MSQVFGIEAHGEGSGAPHRVPARYLVVIDAGGARVARLYSAERELLAEFDAGAEEVALMTQGLRAANSASAAEWDRALGAHDAAERAAAEVYTLDL